MTTDPARRLAWKEAQGLIRITADDWPEVLPAGDIGALHAWDGKSAQPDRAKAEALAAFLDDEIAAGRIKAERITRKEWPQAYSLDGKNPDWEIPHDVIHIGDCARALAGLELGPYLRHWLAPALAHHMGGRPDLSWNKAAAVLRLTTEERAAGWPDELTPDRLARLQYPREGTEAEKKRALSNQRELFRTITSAIEAGILRANTRTRTETTHTTRNLYAADDFRNSWDTRDRPARIIKVPTGERTTRFYTIKRADFAAFLDQQREEPSEHIRAWLRPLEQAAAHQEASVAPPKPGTKTQADRVAHWLAECESRAANDGYTFDRGSMPGTKAEFLALLHALDADLRSVKRTDSLDRYLKATGCKWPLDASAQPSAAPLYARLFPEATIRPPGAVPRQRRKA